MFDPGFYAASWWQASLGDLLINELLILLVVVHTLKILRKQNVLNQAPSLALITLVYSISLVALVYHILELQSVLNNSQWTLDISKDISLDWMKMASYLALFITGVIYFLITQNTLTVLDRFKNKQLVYLILILPLIVGLILLYFNESVWFMALALHSLYLVVIYKLKLSSQVNKTSYQTFLYFFITAFLLAFVHTYILLDHINKEDIEDKEKLATELLSENDLTAEYLLQNAKINIEEDILIQTNISSPFRLRI